MAVLLSEKAFSIEEAKRAEQWIVYGSWREFRGKDGTVELRDFYPTNEQLPMEQKKEYTYEQRLAFFRKMYAESNKFFANEVHKIVEYGIATLDDFDECGESEIYEPTTKRYDKVKLFAKADKNSKHYMDIG